VRLPWGPLAKIQELFLKQSDFALLGCLSFEERSCAVPERLTGRHCKQIRLLEIRDPIDAFPDNRIEAQEKVSINRDRLERAGIAFSTEVHDLLTPEDGLLDIIDYGFEYPETKTLVLDITALPKRFFCLFVKRLTLFHQFDNIVATYTLVGSNGYTHEHLAEDPMSCDHLPGFAAPLPAKRGGETLVVSVGFEALSIRSLFDVYRDRRGDVKAIMSFPADLGAIRRGWTTLREMTAETQYAVERANVEVVATWDAETVYKVLGRWSEVADGLTLAPFGPKPHSLAMALFATKSDCGLYYTQPKSYNPDYSHGVGDTWAYVIKWSGIPCFDRAVSLV